MKKYRLHFLSGEQGLISLNDTPISQGADGAIYISKEKQLAIKLYHEVKKDKVRQQKIWQMIQQPPQQVTEADFAWPVAVVSNLKDAFLGYAMPLINMQSHTELENILSTKLRQHMALSHHPLLRIKAAISLAQRVASLHQVGHFIIDLKPVNLTLHKTSGEVTILDCDGFAIASNNKSRYPAHQYTAGYIAPEAFSHHLPPTKLGLNQDLFALAVIIFQLINNGIHPFQGVPVKGESLPTDNQARIAHGLFAYGHKKHPLINPSPWSIHQDLPAALTYAFEQSLTGIKRVNAKDWYELLTKQLNTYHNCKHNAEHAFWGSSCPWCQLDKARQTPIKVKRISNKRPTKQTYPTFSAPIAPNTATPITMTTAGASTSLAIPPSIQALLASTAQVNPPIQNGPFFPHVSWLQIIVVNVILFVLFIFVATEIGERFFNG
ncbi:protein kinase domain-containing protein [Motilimonas eburnea]|uniref:protein kinase domain-containing protein n=1 Tax=Motilimonas eburnea TaxID=1737488 RepID=UPI001E449E9B|nr:hypothetical protein [Motilimonas eburnea]MCE2573892.1 hypothetical protein [Motilimonas eburnea]